MFDFNLAMRQGEDLSPVKYKGDFLSDFKYVVNCALSNSLDITPVPDGKIHRFGHKKNYWYILFNNAMCGVAVGEYGSWSDGSKNHWTNWEESGNNQIDLEYHAMLEQLRIEREKDRIQTQTDAKEKAKEVYEKAIPLTKENSHPYLETKKVQAFGDIRLYNGQLLLPAIKDGEITTYQTIGASGEKFFLPGGEKKGSSFIIPPAGGETWETVYFAEGYATAASIHMATGLPVVVAFDAGNLPVVARDYRAQHKDCHIIICGDNDENNRGQEAAEQAALWSVEGGGSRVLIPDEIKTDWNDIHVKYGLNVLSEYFDQEVFHNNSQRNGVPDILQWNSVDRFTGKAPTRRMLVSETIPMSAVFLFAAMGDAGKGMLCLDLALKVARRDDILSTAFGKDIMEHGKVVIISAEDDADEIHRRIENLGGPEPDLYIVPLPNAGGTLPLIIPGKKGQGAEVTQAYLNLKKQLLSLQPKLIIIDPLASFIMANINADPAVAAFTTGTFAALAQETGAAIIMPHHMTKTKDQITTPEAARGLVRGSTALVDGVRGCYVMWQAPQSETNKICQAINEKSTRNKVFYGCVVKSNGPADREIKTFVRNDIGLLEVRSVLSQKVKETKQDVLDLMERVVAWAAETGHPFTHRGSAGIFQHKERLPKNLQSMSRRDMDNAIQTLLNNGKICKYKKPNSSAAAQWLDVNDGILSKGVEIKAGDKAPHWVD